MKADDLLLELYQREIYLSREGENLRYRAKPGKLTPELKEAVKEHKAVLLEFLSSSLESSENNADLAWRIAALRVLRPTTGPIGFLSARPNIHMRDDVKDICPSCGDPLPAIWRQRFRCTACTRAAWLALGMGDPLALVKDSFSPPINEGQ